MEVKSIKLNKKVCIFLFIIFTLFMMSTTSFAGTQRWNSLDYKVTLNSDGSADVVETWDVYVSETNTLFKTFDLSTFDKYKIVNPRVTIVENGYERDLRQIDEQQYHVDSGCYYGLQINSYEYEIAWNVGLDNSYDDRVYKMYYTIENAVTLYNDCAEFYWQFLSNENGMYGERITGQITLPEPVDSLEELRVWAHGPLTGEITKASTSTATFYIDSIYANEMLETRIVVEDPGMFYASSNYEKTNKLEDIIAEETVWADEANREREEAKAALGSVFFGFIVFLGANAAVVIFAILKSGQYKKTRKEFAEKYGDADRKFDLIYFRDIPEEAKATPARAVYLRNFAHNSSNLTTKLSEIFAATILNLSLKGILRFETDQMKKIKIYINEDVDSNLVRMTEDERVIFNLIKDALGRNRSGDGYITPDMFNYYARRNYDHFHMEMESIITKVERILEEEYKIDIEKKDLAKKWSGKFTIYLVFAIFTLFLPFVPGIFIAMVILSISSRKVVKSFSFLTYSGAEEAAMWKGLERYMEEYSMLDEKLAGDIVLWEKYLVYATAFGDADKVIKQIRIVHPEMFDPNNSAYNSRMGYWHVINTPYGGYNTFESLTRDLRGISDTARSAYSTAHSSSSSGSGGGGGFSGGGGGGGGGGSCGGR